MTFPAMHKLNFEFTSQTTSGTHASSRLSRGGTKTGLKRAAEIEPTIVVNLHNHVGCPHAGQTLSNK